MSSIKVWRVSRNGGMAKEAEVAHLYPYPGGGDPVLRYLLTFRVDSKGKLIVIGKKRFNDFGLLIDSGLDLSVPKSIFNPMARRAAAILFESHT